MAPPDAPRRPRRLTLPLFSAVLAVVVLACGGPLVELGLPTAGGGLPVRVRLQPGTDPARAVVTLDGADVTSHFVATAGALEGVLPLPAPGAHVLAVEQPWLASSLLPLQVRKRFEVPAAAPAFVGFAPAPVGGAVAQTAWLRLDFAGDVAPEALAGFGFGLACNGTSVPRVAHRVDGRSIVLDPAPSLPAGACRVAWRGPAGVEEHAFAVAPQALAGAASVLYRRSAPETLPAFPDDWWTVDDATTATGLRIRFELPPFGDARDAVLGGIARSLADRDGWSPVGPIVLAFSHAVERSLLPADEAGSVDPLAPVALFDADPASPGYGARVPYSIEARDDLAPDGSTEHALLLYPATTLRASGRYALVVTRRLVVAGDAARPFAASEFFAAVLEPPSAADDAATVKVRGLVAPLLDFVETAPAVPMPREDVALAVRISTRSTLRDPADLVSIKQDALGAAPPALTVQSVTTTAARTLVVRGTLALPDYLGAADSGTITRDGAGRPTPGRVEAVPFLMTLPAQALAGPVPIVIYQHGSPGSPNELLGTNNEFLDDAGYALVGIQDAANRRFGANSASITGASLVNIIGFGRLPLVDFLTHANLMYLLRALEGIAATDWLPAGAPDGRAELDTTKLLYRGISFGAHHSLGFLPFAPEITAAASVVGSGRVFETSLHQIDFFGSLAELQGFLPTTRPTDFFVGLAALQNDQDRQDSYFLARHFYRERLAIPGVPAGALPPSLLWIEGIGDHVVPNNATRAAAEELGIPQVGNVRRVSPLLEQEAAPLAGNVGPTRSAGHYQYEPTQTPSCVAAGQLEGHYCPQRATEARAQILRFFETALSGAAPEIVDPLP